MNRSAGVSAVYAELLRVSWKYFSIMTARVATRRCGQQQRARMQMPCPEQIGRAVTPDCLAGLPWAIFHV